MIQQLKFIQRFGNKHQCESYSLCFDFSNLLGKWERINKKHICVSAVDAESNADVTDLIIDQSKQLVAAKKIYTRIYGGDVGHKYMISSGQIRTNRGCIFSPLTGEILIVE